MKKLLIALIIIIILFLLTLSITVSISLSSLEKYCESRSYNGFVIWREGISCYMIEGETFQTYPLIPIEKRP